VIRDAEIEIQCYEVEFYYLRRKVNFIIKLPTSQRQKMRKDIFTKIWLTILIGILIALFIWVIFYIDDRFNLISTAIGSFLGFLFALIVYWVTEFNKRRNEKHAEKVKAYNTLNRFSWLLKSVIKTCTEQSKLLKLHSDDLKRKPLEFHSPQILATNDRERLVKSDTLELYHSFMLYDKENPSKFKDYKNIYNHSDFLQKYYSDLFIQNEKHQNFLHSDLKLIKNNLLCIEIKIGLLQKDIQLKDPAGFMDNLEFQFLEKYKNIYNSLKDTEFADLEPYKGTGFTDLEPYRDELLIPLQVELFENISQQKIADEIAFQITEAVTRMDRAILNTKTHADSFVNDENDNNVKSALDFLGKIQKKIEKIDEP